jgi:hypothetical protein
LKPALCVTPQPDPSCAQSQTIRERLAWSLHERSRPACPRADVADRFPAWLAVKYAGPDHIRTAFAARIFDQTTNPNQPKGLKMTDVETTALAWKLNELTQARLSYSEAQSLIAKLIEAGYAITVA